MLSNTALELIRRHCGYRFPRLGRKVFDFVFAHSPRYIEAELVPGIRAVLDLSDGVQRATYWQGQRYERPTFRVLNRWRREGGATHFFDVGSNYGFFTFALLARDPTLKAHAFEPNSTSFSQLAEIKAKNSVERLTVWNIALGDKSCALELHRAASGLSTFGDQPDFHLSDVDVVEVVSFDMWRDRVGLPLPREGSWIAKIDVEGFELRVLQGMRQSLEARAFRGLAVEVNPSTLASCGATPEEIYSLMETMGYAPMAKRRRADNLPASDNEFFVSTRSARHA